MSNGMNQLATDTGGRYYYNFTTFVTPLASWRREQRLLPAVVPQRASGRSVGIPESDGAHQEPRVPGTGTQGVRVRRDERVEIDVVTVPISVRIGGLVSGAPGLCKFFGSTEETGCLACSERLSALF